MAVALAVRDDEDIYALDLGHVLETIGLTNAKDVNANAYSPQRRSGSVGVISSASSAAVSSKEEEHHLLCQLYTSSSRWWPQFQCFTAIDFCRSNFMSYNVTVVSYLVFG